MKPTRPDWIKPTLEECPECHERLVMEAYLHDDEWYLSVVCLGVFCHNDIQGYIEWPFIADSASADDLKALGFEVNYG